MGAGAPRECDEHFAGVSADEPLASDGALDALARWEDSGATWRVLEVDDRRAVVQLCACTGEPVERLRSDDPRLIAHVRGRPSSEA